MGIMKYDTWVGLSASKRIIYYPEFYYGDFSTNHKVLDIYSLESEVREHLFKIKLLLLYFDYVNLPFGHFYAPFNKATSKLFYLLFDNKEFRSLISNHYILYAMKPTGTPLEYWSWLGEELSRCSFNALPANGSLKSIFQDLLIVERSSAYLNRSRDTLEDVALLAQASDYSHDDIELIKRAIDKSLLGGHSFMHEVFVYELQDEKFTPFHNAMANYYFKTSERTNFNTLSYRPLSNNAYGSILRKNLLNDVYTFLYSPEFFVDFISLFLDDNEKMSLYKLSAVDISRIRAETFWKNFTDEYHNLIISINQGLNGAVEQNILDMARSEIARKVSKGNRWKYSESFVIEVLKGLIPIVGEAIFNQNLEDGLKLSHLKYKFPAVHEFIRYIQKNH